MSLQEKYNRLRSIMIDRYDGNAGEILHGFQEMGFKGNKLIKAMENYIKNVPAYEED